MDCRHPIGVKKTPSAIHALAFLRGVGKTTTFVVVLFFIKQATQKSNQEQYYGSLDLVMGGFQLVRLANAGVGPGGVPPQVACRIDKRSCDLERSVGRNIPAIQRGNLFLLGSLCAQ
jgi:hypothetical protein